MITVDSAELIGLIKKQLMLGDKIFRGIGEAIEKDVPKIGKTGNAAVMVAGLSESYYTCIETAYHKISQHFENHLNPARWHAELLKKMTLSIEGIRIPAVSDDAYLHLQELQRFRHFKRYYFELEYDWDRIDFLLKKLHTVHPMVHRDLELFIKFLREL